jgi:hypothetical protein
VYFKKYTSFFLAKKLISIVARGFNPLLIMTEYSKELFLFWQGVLTPCRKDRIFKLLFYFGKEF